ncbi:MAG: hypothetical protein JO333_00185 [Verrucomicrobia bacterium]|nr:hypothetical protein [Verrucomicrobiota bacterium]
MLPIPMEQGPVEQKIDIVAMGGDVDYFPKMSLRFRQQMGVRPILIGDPIKDQRADLAGTTDPDRSGTVFRNGEPTSVRDRYRCPLLTVIFKDAVDTPKNHQAARILNPR